ncbi:hypothetical protein L1987_79751 [Smallanthus sonchifolius]|uniref:Uncharacterized protein n=1 Tax=Smallanthus sonchifolius TaxID=185202 RepID=A0ACB8YLT4_9ASTR|nr:hypothetical protein L1987_79751 [Smallanthus sonchifolius]
MGSNQEKKPHALCIPAPLQGHISPMLKLAKILHSKGFLITFVNTEFNHQRLLRSQGLDALHALPSFHFETIPDGLPPPENPNATQDIPSLFKSFDETCLGPFKSLVIKVNSCYAPVSWRTCLWASPSLPPRIGYPGVTPLDQWCCFLILDGLTTEDSVGEEVEEDIMTQMQNMKNKKKYKERGIDDKRQMQTEKSKDEKGENINEIRYSSYLVNGYLDTVLDCVPSMHVIRLKDIPHFIRYINPDDEYLAQFLCFQVERAKRGSAIIFNTFDELEHDALDTLASMYPPCYGIGPLHLLEKNIVVDESLESIKSNLWEEEKECLKWLDSQAPLSVIYVNFGSITPMHHNNYLNFVGD